MRAKQNRPKQILNRKCQYDPKTLLLAYEAVKEEGWNVHMAARAFGVPEQTLRDRTRGAINPFSCRTGPKTTLSSEEEETLVAHAESMAKLGYSFTNRQFQMLAGELMFNLGKKTDTKPLSNNWLYAFISRWKDRLASLAPCKLEKTCAKSLTTEAVNHYFRNLEEIITKYSLQSKPHLICNVDETCIHPCQRLTNVKATPGGKLLEATSLGSTVTTIIACVNAVGNAIPPFFICKGKCFHEDVLKSANPDARGVVSDSGLSNSKIFKKYLEEHFLPLIGERSKDEPILLILDGHDSHISPSLIEWAKEKHIIFCVSPAHTSQVLQPLDMAVFGPFKKLFKQECASLKEKNDGQTITEYDMAQLFCCTYLKAMKPVNIKSAFRDTGIFPLNKDVISHDVLFPGETFGEEIPVKKECASKSGKEAVQEIPCLKDDTGNSPESQNVNCHCHSYKVNKKAEKENMAQKRGTVDNLSHSLNQASPQASTSDLNVQKRAFIPDLDSEEKCVDDVPCCVCKKTSPSSLQNYPNVISVLRAQCDICSH